MEDYKTVYIKLVKNIRLVISVDIFFTTVYVKRSGFTEAWLRLQVLPPFFHDSASAIILTTFLL